MDSQRIADYIINRYKSYKRTITNLKLQKLLYYIQGYFFKVFKKRAFDEEIVNWTYGPVVPEIYHKFKIFGPEPLEIFDDEDIDMALFILNEFPEEKKLIDRIIEKSFEFDAFKLVDMTHSEMPWRSTKLHEEISVEYIKDYFNREDPLKLYVK